MVSLCLFLFTNGFSQNHEEKEPEVNLVMYKVQLGETVRLISRKYFVAPSQIYKYNKYATDGVSEGNILYIPVPKKETVYVEKEETSAPVSSSKHTAVKQKEVVTQPVSTEKAKEVVAKTDKVLKVENNPETNNNSKDVINSQDSNIVTHKVQPHETLYGLAKMYNITVDELKEQNQTVLKNGLQVGQVLTIKKNN